MPLLALLDQFAVDFPGFCKVGTGHNERIDFGARGFIAVRKSAHLLQKLTFDAVFVDEAHHPLPPKLPKKKELFQFSATLEQEEGIDFQYTMGKAIEDGVLCDYDITVPAVTAHHAYVCLADLLMKQAGRFRRVLAYCNTVAEAKRFQMVLEELGLGAWHMNAATGWKERKSVMDEFTGVLKKPVHVLVTVEVLGEGINIPNADTCMFVEPRNSYRSIIQAIGRVLRHHPDKPLGHIILPAVAVPERGPAHVPGPADHVPGAPSSTELKQQTENCKEQSLSQKAPVSRSLVELDVSLLENLETRKDVRTRQSTGVLDDSSDADEETGQGAKTMGNGPVRGTELLHAPQERQTSNKRRQGNASSKQDGTKNNQFTATAGSRAGAAVQSQMLPESRAIGSSSRTNPLAISGGQTVRKSQEVHAELNSSPQNHITLKGKELKTNTTDVNKMGFRYGRVRLQSLEGVGSSAQEYQSQLDRFLAKLMQADDRLIGSRAGHRIQVVDCRIGVAGEVGMDAATNAIYGRLTALLMQTDPWEVRFERFEEYVREHQRLPRQRGKDTFEASLSTWWSNQNINLKLGGLPAHRLQRLQSTPVGLIQQRVGKWLAGGAAAIFKQRCQDLRRHMQKHNQIPSRSSPDPETRKLGGWLWRMRHTLPRSRVKDINLLKVVHPLVEQLFQWDMHPLKINEIVWCRKLEELSTFVCQHRRLPSQHRTSKSESSLYRWLWRQRSRIWTGNLPEKFVAALKDAQPLISEAVAIAESNYLSMRSDKEHVKWFQPQWSKLTNTNADATLDFTLDFCVPTPVQFCAADWWFHELYRHKMPQASVSCTNVTCADSFRFMHVSTNWILFMYLLCQTYFQCSSLKVCPPVDPGNFQLPRTWGTVWAQFRRGCHSFAECAGFHGISIYEILTMRHCRRRGNVNLDGVASSKRSLFWMIVAIAAACSVLRERATFATSPGRFPRTLLQHSFHFRIMYGASQSFCVKSVKDGNFRFHDLLGGVGCFSFASRRWFIKFH